MNYEEQIQNLLKEAKALPCLIRKNLYSSMLANIQNELKRKKPQKIDAEFMDRMAREYINGIDQALAHLPETDSRIATLRTEKTILRAYLMPIPVPLTEEQIQNIIVEAGTPVFGLIMKHFKENYAKRYDGEQLAALVKQTLSK